MPAPIIPWQPSNIPFEIQSELNRRKVNRGMSYVKNQTANWDAKTGDWNTYRGPMTSWIRMCSNSAGHPLVDRPRFVLHSGKGFYQSYGFNPAVVSKSQYQVIGYTPNGNKHIIENTLTNPSGESGNYPIHVPPPEISRIEVTVQKELFRRATIEWVCFSWKQLEYMTPYFLIPGITVMVEWGWNHFNPVSLVPLHDVDKMKTLWGNAYPLYSDNIIQSNGNYDVIYGIITNFNWSIEGNKIVCSTEVTSKDRLYSGIAKDNSLIAKEDDKNEPPGIFQDIKNFLTKDDTIRTIKSLAASSQPLQTLYELGRKQPNFIVFRDILRPILSDGGPEVIAMRRPYIHGVFAGRPKDFYEDFGKPQPKDFDVKVLDNDVNNLWINMGMIVEILNYFSGLPGGKDKPMFKVDIQNSVIGGHPNLISCDPRVLIPNYQAPKYHYGAVGINSFNKIDQARSDYLEQYVKKQPSKTKWDEQLRRTMFQSAGNDCYRNDLDSIINLYRNAYVPIAKPLGSWSFPSMESAKLPPTVTGLQSNYVEKDRSGLLTNVYVSFAAFRESVEKGLSSKTSTYTEIYKDLLQLLSDATDGFWDLVLVEVDNNMTIMDKKYVGVKEYTGTDPMFTFDYYDANSIIKSIKFRPTLTDAQATRAIYGEANNKESKYAYSDKNDLLDYKFKDAINFSEKERKQGDADDETEKRNTARQQTRDLIGSVQYIDKDSGDNSLQMTFQDSTVYNDIPVGKKEIVKLVLPNPQLLRMLLDDKDEDNNPRYCAVQPGIILEMTILGIGGIRTFQYFLVKNLPEPYSHRNIVFRVTDVHQTLESGNWETTIRAQLLPLKKYIKLRVNGPNPDGSWPPDSRDNKS